MKIKPEELHALAKRAAQKAGNVIAKAFGSSLSIHKACHHDIKLDIDTEVQELLTKIILKKFPAHSILGEEGGEGGGGKGYEWIIDPIDGTVNLYYGIPHFCVSIACRYENEILIGVIFDPIRKECFSAIKGKGAILNGHSIHVSSRSNIKEAVMALGFSKGAASIDKCLDLYQYYGPRARKLRAMGSAALDMAYIASGRIDAYIEQGIKIWDIAAGMLILQEAGGKIVLTPNKIPNHFHICASNGLLDLPKV